MRRIMHSILAIVALVVVMAMPARADNIVEIDRDTSDGLYAGAMAHGLVDYPSRLWVKVRVRPNQRVHVDWSLTCYHHGDSRSRDGGFRAITPVKRVLRIPYAEADRCSVTATAQVDDLGRLVVILLARVP
jgi:hypothetical protein